LDLIATLHPPDNAASRRVYYCTEEIATRLQQAGSCWQIIAAPDEFLREDAGLAVLIADRRTQFSPDLCSAVERNLLRVIYLIDATSAFAPQIGQLPIFAFIQQPVAAPLLQGLVAAAFENLASARRQVGSARDLLRARNEISLLNEIGIALSTQRDRESLLALILQKSREITRSDAGSLYLVEENSSGERQLHFEISQNDSVQFRYPESSLLINGSSIAGYVALTGEDVHLEDVYQISPSFPFHFNRKFDDDSGYRTKSILAVPMKNPQGEIIGVVQLINSKRAVELRVSAESADDGVIPYPEESQLLVRSLASQAAVAIENNRLYESIETLFEGFVKASVSAIEARDPATSGHSFRVADMTLRLAEMVDRDDSPSFREVRFGRAEMQEIRYASLLHDFGKVGVREDVLVKAKKLYPGQLELVKQRFAFVRKAREHEQSERKLRYLLEKGREEFLARQVDFQRFLDDELRELDEFLIFVTDCNEPTVLREGNFARLAQLAERQFVDETGQVRPLLTEQEVKLLSISKGTLDDHERLQIESHVTHTLNFLRQIPWTKDIKNIPSIASAHHEKLDSTGYPGRLSASEIPLQSKMMTIADIYDALAAADRPYKKALPWEKALEILAAEAQKGLVDAELLGIFRAAEVYRLAAKR